MKEIDIKDKKLTFNYGNWGDVENLYDTLNIELQKINNEYNILTFLSNEKFYDFMLSFISNSKVHRDLILKCGSNCSIDGEKLTNEYFNNNRYIYFDTLITILYENISAFFVAPTL